jgi:hypothetical protein
MDGNGPALDDAVPLCCSDLLVDVGLALRNSFCAVARRRQRLLHRDKVAQAVMTEMQTVRTDPLATVTEQRERSSTLPSTRLGTLVNEQAASKHESLGPVQNAPETPSYRESERAKLQYPSATEHRPSVAIPIKSSLADDGISGKPFIRVSTPEAPMFSPPPSLSRTAPILSTPMHPEERKGRLSSLERAQPSLEQDKQQGSNSVDVPVGVSRLRT